MIEWLQSWVWVEKSTQKIEVNIKLSIEHFMIAAYKHLILMGQSRPIFINFRLYYKKLTVSSIKVAYDWIRTHVLSQPLPNMPTSYPVFVDVVDGPRGSHLLILTLPLAWCAIAVTLV